MTENIRRFKDVLIGSSFRFSSERDFPFSGMKRGECVKLSSRKYQFIDDGMICQVGTINTEVL